ncbi:UDP-N-acetylmuramate dehydrogenase [Candidatus Omnitrophota bacterium]
METSISERLSSLGNLEQDVFLGPLTTFGIGGQARYLFTPSSEENLCEAVGALRQARTAYYVLGRGSNILVCTERLEAVVIKLAFDAISELDEAGCFYAGASVRLARLLGFCLERSLGGAEFLAGLPATLGGALVTNASFKGTDIFSLVERVKVFDPDSAEVAFRDKDGLEYGYRYSSLKGSIVLGAVLRFAPKDKHTIRTEIRNNVVYRLTRQEPFFSAGCIFKNPRPGVSAGQLIEEAGCKGLRKGGARISPKHANFIINEKEAGFRDVLFLIEEMKEKVYNKSGVVLEEEIERWGC